MNRLQAVRFLRIIEKKTDSAEKTIGSIARRGQALK
jgi:hypothetical protein